MCNWLPVGCALGARHDKNASVEGAFRREREREREREKKRPSKNTQAANPPAMGFPF